MTSLPSALTWRGALAVIVGIVSIAWPHITVGAVVVLFAIYVIADAAGQLAVAYRLRGTQGANGHLVLGVLDLAAGVVALTWPTITAVVVVVAVGLWAIVTGVVEMAVALRFPLPPGERGLVAAAGAISILLGVVLLAHPDAGALALAWLFGLFSLVFGIGAIMLGRRLRRSGQDAGRVTDQLFGRGRPGS